MKLPFNPLWHLNHVSYQIICDLEFTGGKNRENKTLKQEMLKQKIWSCSDFQWRGWEANSATNLDLQFVLPEVNVAQNLWEGLTP